jgi:hypothetical protein
VVAAKPVIAMHQRIEQIAAFRALGLSNPLPSNNRPPTTAPAALAPRSILVVMPEVVGELRYLRLKGIAHPQRSGAARKSWKNRWIHERPHQS